MFNDKLKLFKTGELSKDELENEWYKIMHSKPSKKTDRRVFQASWSTHPISKAIVHLRDNSPVHIKKAITRCIKYSKMWWSKSTDTYLFPSYAIALYLNSLPDRTSPVIKSVSVENALKVYADMESSDGPSLFIKYIVSSDQHTALGSKNGVGKKSPYSTCTFSLYHSAVRPYTEGCEEVFRKYIDERLPNMPDKIKEQAHKNLLSFGRGETTHMQLWDQQCVIMKAGLGLMAPKDYTYWSENTYARKQNLSLKHPNPNCMFHFRSSPLIENWNIDSLISCLQKMIRRSCLWEATWATCRFCMFALFHTEIGDEMWTIWPGAQAKVTNVINRLIVIAAEDLYPDAKMFYEITVTVESARKILLDLKTPQTKELYMKRFGILTSVLLTVVTSLIHRPKQHYIGWRLFKFGKWYEEAGKKIDIDASSEVKKRKANDIRTLFNF